MEHCLLDPSKKSWADVCPSCRHRVHTIVRNELPTSPPRLARVLSDEIEEITDHVLDATLRSAASIEEGKLVAWVYRCVKNRVTDRVRFWKADRRTIDREIDATRGREAMASVKDPTRPGPGLVTRIDMADQIARIKQRLKDFEGPEVEAFRLRFFEDSSKTWPEVGMGEGSGDRLRMRCQALAVKLRDV